MSDLLGLPDLQVAGPPIETATMLHILVAPRDDHVCSKLGSLTPKRNGKPKDLLEVADTLMQGKPVLLVQECPQLACKGCGAPAYTLSKAFHPTRDTTDRLVRHIENLVVKRNLKDVARELSRSGKQITTIALDLLERLKPEQPSGRRQPNHRFAQPDIVAMDGIQRNDSRFQTISDGRTGKLFAVSQTWEAAPAWTALTETVDVTKVRVFAKSAMRALLSLLAAALALAAPGTAAAGAIDPQSEAAILQAVDGIVVNTRSLMMTDPARGYAIGRDYEQKVKSLPPSRLQMRALARARWIIGEAALRSNRTAEAASMVASAIDLARRSGDIDTLADSHRSRGAIREQAGDAADALRNYLAASRLYRQVGNARGQSVVLQDLGRIYAQASDYERAERYLRQAGQVYAGDPMLTMTLADGMGNILSENKRYADAIAEYRIAERISRRMNMASIEVHVLGNLAEAQIRLGHQQDATASIGRAVLLAGSDGAGLTDHILTDKAMLAEARGDIASARRFMDSAVAKVGPAISTQGYDGFNLTAYEIYKRAGDAQLALHHLEIARRLRDEMVQLAISTKASLMTAEFDYASQELRIAQIKTSNLSRSMGTAQAASARLRTIFTTTGLVGVALLIISIIGIETLRRSRDRERTANTALERALAEVKDLTRGEAHATEMAQHDVLTGLPNRRQLQESLYEDISRCRQKGHQCAVLLLDLDKFKPVNDIHGHAVGDALLIQVSERLRTVCETHGATAARLGGDEFVIVHTCSTGDAIPAKLAEDVVAAISNPYQIYTRHLVIGASIGIARTPGDGTTIDELLRAADIAMYEAKSSGRKTWRFFDETMETRLRRRSEIENELRSAVRDGNIEAHFQPIHRLDTGVITGFEALARWNHPWRGTITPDEFIPIAEEAGLIGDLTISMLRQACNAARDWPDHLTVSVNISPVLLRDNWISARTFAILAQAGLSARRLVVEITENAVIDDVDRADDIITSFRSAGIRVALDDFGTGYSSLIALKDLDFDFLKLDRSFVMSIDEADSAKITAAVAGLGLTMHMPLTAEGVETPEAAQQLHALGFTYGQGYHFGRAMTPENAKLAAWPHDGELQAGA